MPYNYLIFLNFYTGKEFYVLETTIIKNRGISEYVETSHIFEHTGTF